MENGLSGPLLEMPALSENPGNSRNSENGSGTSTSELLCNINHPEDVGAVVTSFCKLGQDGQIQKEVFEGGLYLQQPQKFSEINVQANNEGNGVEIDQEEADLDDEMDLDEAEVNEVKPETNQINGQNEVKEEFIEENKIEQNGIENDDKAAIGIPQTKPKDIIVSIKDENSQSSSEDESDEEFTTQGNVPFQFHDFFFMIFFLQKMIL